RSIDSFGSRTAQWIAGNRTPRCPDRCSAGRGTAHWGSGRWSPESCSWVEARRASPATSCSKAERSAAFPSGLLYFAPRALRPIPDRQENRQEEPAAHCHRALLLRCPESLTPRPLKEIARRNCATVSGHGFSLAAPTVKRVRGFRVRVKTRLASRRGRLQPGILLKSRCRPKGRRYENCLRRGFSHGLFSPALSERATTLFPQPLKPCQFSTFDGSGRWHLRPGGPIENSPRREKL